MHRPARPWLGALLGLALTSPPARAQVPDSAARDTLVRARLPVLTVSATRATDRLERVPHATSVLEGEQITRGRLTDGLDEVLRRVPGTVVQHRYNYALDQQLSIRGFGARSAFGVRGIVVVLDGIPQTLPDGQGQLTNLELSEVERVEVLRGAASVLYGNAAGGVVALHTAHHPPDRAEASARLAAAHFGFLKTQVTAASPTGSGGIRAGASLTHVDGFRDHSAAELRRASLRVLQPLGRATLAVHLHGADMPWAEHPGALTAHEAAVAPSSAASQYVATGAGKAVSQAQLGVVYHRPLGRDDGLEVAVFALRRGLENTLPFGRIQLDRWAYGVRTQASVPLPVRGARATLGLDAVAQRDDRTNRALFAPEVTLAQRERVVAVGPFAQGAFGVGPVTLSAGARYDRTTFRVDDRLVADGDDSGTRVMEHVSWVVGLAAELPGGIRPYGSVGTTFETPTTTELVNRPDGGGGLNAELAPQHALHLELGMRGGGGRVRWAVALFRADVRDALIPFEDPAVSGRRFFRNAGRVRQEGVEGEAQVAVGSLLRVWGAATLARNRFAEFRVGADTLDGKRLPALPQAQLAAGAELDHPSGFWMAVEGRSSSGVFADDANAVSVDGWSVLDGRAGWRGPVGTVTVEPFAAVLNVLNRRYVGSVNVNAQGGRYFEPSPGRSLLVGLTVAR